MTKQRGGKTKMKKSLNILTIVLAVAAMIAAFSCPAQAAVTGVCSNCHTMHNSQGGAEMATFGGETGANDALVRGSCLGCHGQLPSGSSNMITDIPQVLHANATDLAGGNFAYIKGGKDLTAAGATTSTVGHNVIDLSVAEGTLTKPPGDEHDTGITQLNFTCAGQYGCHGNRAGTQGNFAAISGAHHGGVSGLCDTADTVANSYRFLQGVKGHENMDDTYKYQNYNTQYHNEYWGNVAATEGTSATVPAGNTISGLCGECHGTFHGSDDIGGTSTPFTRHPTDIVLPNKTEYSGYTVYNVQAPVARVDITTVNEAANATVTPGTDAVMCLSCHGAHATAYADILRWDYAGMIAGSTTGEGTGCFICHTTKDD